MGKEISVFPLCGREFEGLCSNDDRGFRFEVYFTPGRSSAWPQKCDNGLEELEKQFAYYAPEQCKIAQVYFYLSDYLRRPLDETAFQQMEAYLRRLKELEIRAVLRFTYEYDVRLSQKKGPTTGRIEEHCAQIGAWFRRNETLAGQTVLALQAGLVGAWGEWHNAQFPHGKRKVLSCLCDMALPWMWMQVRTLPIKRKAKGLPAYGRIGYHDDYLVGENFKWSTPRAKEGTPAYREFLEESRYTLNDGEMPWGRDKVYCQGTIDGKRMIHCCRERCLTTMSLAHNYREDGGVFNMERWKRECITPRELEAMGCSFAPSYFQNADGTGTERSVYEYLRDHLGYQLMVERAAVEKAGAGIRLCLTLANHGFARPYGFEELSVCVKTADGTRWVNVEGYRWEELLCGQSVRLEVELPEPVDQKAGLRLRNTRAPQLVARFANRLNEKDGIQVLDWSGSL